MALNDVKELKVPDSRYRELEYIIFNGAEYVNTGLDNTNSDLELKLSVKKSVFPSQRGTVWTLLGSQDGASYPSEIDKYWLGCIDYSSHYSNYSTPRFIGHWHTGSAGIYPDASYTTNAWNLFTDDDVVRIVYGGVKSTSGNSYTWECGVKDLEGNILFSNEHTGNTSYTMSNKFWLMANHLSNGANEYAVGKVYGLVEKISNLNFIPAQRKSDNKCGLFETKNGVFYPMGGTTTLTAAAGPTVREYVPYLVDVVKINQPSGRIIWGSQTYFPYRRLEYVHLNGAEYIDTGLKANYPKNRAIWVKTDSDMTTTSARIIGAYNSASNDNARRCYFVANRDGGFGFALGNQWVGGKATSYKYDKVLLYGTINSTGKTTSWGVKSPDDVTTYESGSLTTGAAVGQTAKIFIGTNSNDSSQPDTTVYYKGNIYLYRIKNTDGSGPIENDMYPCQRKSDGVCGIYDVKTSIFHPMVGTTITDGAAGPVVDEYWDLTAPS